MKITFITPSFNLGGYEKVVINYANELIERGHKVDILCGCKSGKLLNTISSSVKIYNFNSRLRMFIFPLIKYLRREKPDILYSGFREYNCICVLAKLFSSIKTCIYASQHGFQKNSKICEWIMGRIIAKADRIIAVANGIADYESTRLSLDRKRFLILNNPVINSKFEIPDKYHPWFDDIKETPIIVMAGRISGDKGEKQGIDILAEINKYRNVRLIYLGDGPAINDIKAYANEKGVSDKIDFLGYVDCPMGYMKHCTMLLHTAIIEGFGNVVVEALYSNIPVCVTNCSGPMQIIEDGKFGINLGVVSDKDFVINASKKIEDLLAGKITFNRMDIRALDFNIQNATNQFLAAK